MKGDQCDRCVHHSPSTGCIPLPDGLRPNRIEVCDVHKFEARQRGFWVMDYDGGPASGTSEFEHIIKLRHRKLRGTDELVQVPGVRRIETKS